MPGEPNFFDFLHNQKGMTQKEADLVISKSKLLSKEKFVEQLLDFLHTANDKSIRELGNFAFWMRNLARFQFQMSLLKDKSPTQVVASQPQFHPILLAGFRLDDLLSVQQALRDKEIGEIVKRKLPAILIEATENSMKELQNDSLRFLDILNCKVQQVKKGIANLIEQYNTLKEQAENSPPATYQIFSKPRFEDLGRSFSSFANAKKFIFEARSQKNDNDNKDLNSEEPDFFVVEIQAKNLQELDEAKQAFVSNYSSLRDKSPSWPNAKINSIAFFTQGKEEERQYNPDGSNDIARTIKQLDLMINRLQQTNWLWKLLEVVTGRSGLTDKKIQALKEIKNEVFMQKCDIETKAVSLWDVLKNQFAQQTTQENQTTTYSTLLNEHRFGFSQKPTNTDERVDELIQGIKPK